MSPKELMLSKETDENFMRLELYLKIILPL
jgi:hypothetical protein